MRNVTRSLAINAYRFWDQTDGVSIERWFEDLEQQFSADRLSDLVTRLAQSIGAKILSLSSIPYEPYGASAALLVGQEQHHLAHLDSSHIAAHSYFDGNDHFGQFRLELEISTCGQAHPSNLIGTVVEETMADFVQLDYRIRGLIWREEGGPEVARGTLEAEAIQLEGFETSHAPDGANNSTYVELTRIGLRPSIRQRLEKMLSKPSAL